MIKILGFNIYDDNREKLMKNIMNTDGKLHIVSGNPEVLYNGMNNTQLQNSFTRADTLIFPDGAGVVIASKILKTPVKEKIAGIELMEDIISYCADQDLPVYMLGAEENILIECISRFKSKFPSLVFAGSHNGFFDIDNCGEIIDDINSSKPYVLFVAMGSPRQEIFISRYMDVLDCRLFMGVGGSFDVIAGKLNRAPEWMIKLNLEWLYRVAKEPWRLKRLGSIPKFMLKAILKSEHN